MTDATSGNTSKLYRRLRRHTLFVDRLAVAAEAVALGSAHAEHWRTLATFVQREGLARTASAILACQSELRPTREWWHYALLTSLPLSPDERREATCALLAIEHAGGGPAFDAERHVVLVQSALDFLREHLARVHAGSTSREEMREVAGVIDAVRLVGGFDAAGARGGRD